MFVYYFTGGGTVRKGILKRNPNKGTTSGNSWEYELAPPSSLSKQGDTCSEQSPDIIPPPQIPLSIPLLPNRGKKYISNLKEYSTRLKKENNLI